MKKLIINADDFGRSNSVNKAIDECMKKNYISSTTLMVNIPYAEEAVAMAKESSYIDKVGLHLNLTEGEPLTERMKNNRLFIGEDGRFTGDFHRKTATRLILNHECKECVKSEIEAQIRKYIDLVGEDANMHIDSHHHIHTDMAILSSIEDLIIKYNIKSVRLSRTFGMDESIGKRVYKNIYNKRLRSKSLFCTDEMGTFKDYFENVDSIIDKCITELECHPDYEGEILINRNSWGEKLFSDFQDYLNSIGQYKLINWPV